MDPPKAGQRLQREWSLVWDGEPMTVETPNPLPSSD